MRGLVSHISHQTYPLADPTALNHILQTWFVALPPKVLLANAAVLFLKPQVLAVFRYHCHLV